MNKDKNTYIVLLQCLLLFSLLLSSCTKGRSKYRKVYSGEYRAFCGIELGIVDDSHIEAFIYSHDFVGHRSDVYKGTYASNPPFITVRWDDKDADVDLRYMIHDEDNDRMIVHGQYDTYYLSCENEGKKIDNDSINYIGKSLKTNIDTCDYYILEKDRFTNEYATNRQELLLPDGYHLSYDQILAKMWLFYPPVSSLDEQPYLLGITAAPHHFDALPLPVHFQHYAHRGATRFVQLLFNKHATKIVFFTHTETDGVNILLHDPSKPAPMMKRGDPNRHLGKL